MERVMNLLSHKREKNNKKQQKKHKIKKNTGIIRVNNMKATSHRNDHLKKSFSENILNRKRIGF